MTTTTDLKPLPAGPGRYRKTQTIRSGWQIWDAGAGEWLTVSVIAEFTSGRVRYVCEETDEDGHITFDTHAGGHKIWSRSIAEQREADRLDWHKTVDGRWLTWKNGRTWELAKHRARDGWYLNDLGNGARGCVEPQTWAGSKVGEAKHRAVELVAEVAKGGTR